MVALALLASLMLTPAASPCPAGDRAAPPRLLELTAARTDFVVDEEARTGFRQGIHLSFRHPGHGPAIATVTLPLLAAADHGTAAGIEKARFDDGAWTRLDDAAAASALFEDFIDAIEHGVDPEAVRPGRERRALLVEQQGERIVVRVAAACSAQRVEVLLVGHAVAAPSAGGLRLHVATTSPAPTSPHVIVVTAPHHEVWIDGHRGHRRALAAPLIGDEEPRHVDDGALAWGATSDLHLVDLHPRAETAPLTLFGLQRTYHPRVTTTAADSVPEPSDAPDASPGAPFRVLDATVQLPTPLTAPTANLRVVFVVDGSISQRDANAHDDTVRLVQAAIKALPSDAGWALVRLGREAELVVPPWRSPEDTFIPMLAVDNGSDVESALTLAARIAADAEPGAGRVIVLSDLHQRWSARPLADVVQQAFKSSGGAAPTMHIVKVEDDLGAFDRPFSPVVGGFAADTLPGALAQTNGTLLTPGGRDDGRVGPSLMRSLLWPTMLDAPHVLTSRQGPCPAPPDTAVAVNDAHGLANDHADDLADVRVLHTLADGHQTTPRTLPGALHAGEALRLQGTVPICTTINGVRAYQWATPVTIPFQSGHTAAFAPLALAGLAQSLSPEAIAAVGVTEHLVTSETSLVAVPQWRPARPEGMGGDSCSCGGTCSVCGGHGVGRATTCGVTLPATLKAQSIIDAIAIAIARRCQRDVDFEVEVHDLEILDVDVREGDQCAEALLWQVRLDQRTPGDGSFEYHRTFRGRAPGPSLGSDMVDEGGDVPVSEQDDDENG